MKHIKRYNQLFENTQELTQEQRDWLDKCSDGSWKLNPETGLVDVDGDFFCYGQGLDSFKGVRFGTVRVGFYCSDNRLTSLKGAPQKVGGSFYCTHNSLTSLEGAPQRVGGSFDCSKNRLTSLEGAPQSVGWSFYCSDNPISERAIRGVLKRMSDKRIPLEEAVEDYWKSIPKVDRPYLAKHHPALPEEEKRGYEAMVRLKGRVI